MTIRVGLAVLFFVGAFGDAAASDEHRFYVSPFWGGSLMEARNGDDPFLILGFEGGFQFGARAGYYLHHRLAVEGSYRYSPNGLVSIGMNDLLMIGLNTFDAQSDSHAFIGDLRYFVMDIGDAVRTFLTAGLGVEIVPERRRTESFLLWNVGGGAEWRLRPGLSLRGDVRYVGYPDFSLTEQSEGGIELQGGIVIGF